MAAKTMNVAGVATAVNAMSALILIGLSVLSPDLALATHGTQPLGIGPKSKSLGGAGVAMPMSAISGAINPALLPDLKDEMDVSLSFFNANRAYNSNSVMVSPNNGSYESSNKLFLLPSLGKVYPLKEPWGWGLFVYPKGGGSVAYKNMATFSRFGMINGKTDGDGVWTSSSLEQVGIAAFFAQKISDQLSLGAGPVFGVQRFGATGLGYFAPVSAHPDKLTDNGYDFSYGYGAQLGVHYKPLSLLQLGLTYQSKIAMTPFQKYSGLIGNDGVLDIAPQWTVGLAWNPFPAWTFVFDYQVIEYSQVPALAKPHDDYLLQSGENNTLAKTVGGPQGAGFGWEDVRIFKLGAQFRWNPQFLLRGGYSQGNSPIGPEDVLFNILAPAVNKIHWSVGFTHSLSEKMKWDLTYVRTLPNSVSGSNPKNLVSDDIELSMNQHDVETGFSMTF